MANGTLGERVQNILSPGGATDSFNTRPRKAYHYPRQSYTCPANQSPSFPSKHNPPLC
jgi:hypothetical protein